MTEHIINDTVYELIYSMKSGTVDEITVTNYTLLINKIGMDTNLMCWFLTPLEMGNIITALLNSPPPPLGSHPSVFAAYQHNMLMLHERIKKFPTIDNEKLFTLSNIQLYVKPVEMPTGLYRVVGYD